ncbi:hypothetical protein L916_02771, partial [Phytophthora nicotianae]
RHGGCRSLLASWLLKHCRMDGHRGGRKEFYQGTLKTWAHNDCRDANAAMPEIIGHAAGFRRCFATDTGGRSVLAGHADNTPFEPPVVAHQRSQSTDPFELRRVVARQLHTCIKFTGLACSSNSGASYSRCWRCEACTVK